ncbi:MAG: WGxxGxxG family protein [Candidatus Tectimicrobiota bacterium]
MQRCTLSTLAGKGVFALGVLLLPLSTPLSAQTTVPAPETRRIETVETRDHTGWWGLLGLLGLFGLMGRRRPETVQTYSTTGAHERSRT